jgi:hypothetical protein
VVLTTVVYQKDFLGGLLWLGEAKDVRLVLIRTSIYSIFCLYGLKLQQCKQPNSPEEYLTRLGGRSVSCKDQWYKYSLMHNSEVTS